MDQQPVTEIKPEKYFVAAYEMQPLTKKVAPDTAFIKADPHNTESWPAGAPVLLPADAMPGAFFLSVSKPEGKKVVVQAYKIVKTADGKLAIMQTADPDADQLARKELDVFSVTPSERELKLASMRRLQAGSPATAENKYPAHVQLLPTHPSVEGVKIQFGMVTPADLARYQKSEGYVAPQRNGALLSRMQQASQT